MLKAKLVVVGGDAKAAEVALSLPTVIGRGRDVTLTLPHPLVSRRHCELFEKDGRLQVRDLKSLNGTYVDNCRIEGTAELQPDQLLTIGAVTFRAIYEPGDSGHEAVPQSASQVIEFDEVASVDGGSEVDPDHNSIRERKTVPSPARPRHPETGNDQPPQRARRPAAITETSDVLDGEEAQADTPAMPQHSIVQAMKEAGAAGRERVAAGSLSEVRRLMPDVAPRATASGIDGLETGEAAAERVGDNDFEGVESGEAVQSRVKPNDSALGSFIRKLPR